MAKETLASMLDDFINEQLDQIVLSNPAGKRSSAESESAPHAHEGRAGFSGRRIYKNPGIS